VQVTLFKYKGITIISAYFHVLSSQQLRNHASALKCNHILNVFYILICYYSHLFLEL
jgi:hypothetical protein